MMEKRRAPGSAATLTGAAETAAFGEISIGQYTTGGADSQRHIADFLRPGAESGVTLSELQRLLGIDSRSIRLKIQRERLAGVPILADNRNGYFLPGTADELQRCVHSMKCRSREIARTARAIERAGIRQGPEDTDAGQERIAGWFDG